MEHFLQLIIKGKVYDLFNMPIYKTIGIYPFKIELEDLSLGEKKEIKNIYDLKEDNDNYYLIESTLFFELIDDKNYHLSKIEKNKIYFNKKTREKNGLVDSFDFPETFDTISLLDIFRFLNLIIESEKIKKSINNIIEKKLTYNSFYINTGKIIVKNLLNLSFHNSLEVEKLINSNNDKILLKNIKEENFKLTSSKKLSKSVGLPSFSLSLIKKNRLEEFISILININEYIDGNDMRILLELINNSRNFLTLSKVRNRNFLLKKFLLDFLYLITIKNTYKTKDLLNYILKQNLYFSNNEDFSFPFEEMNLLKDYISICKDYDLKYEKYPQNILKTHNIVMTNILSFDKIDDIEFKLSVKKYKKYEKTLNKEGYSFIVPENIYSLVEEGNILHHCIGSFCNKIVKGKSKIIFMRKTSEIDIPFITIEIDNSCNIIEIKGMYNKEPDEEYIKIANKWAGICKKIK